MKNAIESGSNEQQYETRKKQSIMFFQNEFR